MKTKNNKVCADIKVDISRAKSSAVGAEHGVTPAELTVIEGRVLAAHKILRKERRDAIYGFYDLYKDKAAFKAVKEAADHFSAFNYDNFVVLGIGGSALGITALQTALHPAYHNLVSQHERKGLPRLFVMDNIDPETFSDMMRVCPPGKTLYNVISKSGGTAETISQLMLVVDMLEKKVGAKAVKDHLVVTTSPKGKNAPKSLLHPVVSAYKLRSFEIPLNVGGRFSIFSPVGMFPAAMLGMDIDAMVAGCAAMDKQCSKASLLENPAYLRAALHYLMDTKKGKCISVMMPYADGLRDVADWYRQLWAESLGKRKSLDGDDVYTGQTPVKALGVTDQHSQVQLYTEGPNNKIFNILEVRRFGKTLRIPDVLTKVKELDYLRGKTMNKLMVAEVRGTLDALKNSKRPAIRIVLPQLNAYTLAQVLYMLEVETAMAGRLYNVNTFDQPGVEEGKQIARKLMGGRG
ncbi:MAG: glucose-6-phosphate isomerase [Candidatus Hydrogenedentes bacterium]|nr:glucose-6-phosphate isomerase [Candidatus Hydrogenedentota bacterium]